MEVEGEDPFETASVVPASASSAGAEAQLEGAFRSGPAATPCCLKAFQSFLSHFIPRVRRTLTPGASRAPKRNDTVEKLRLPRARNFACKNDAIRSAISD